MEASAPAEDPLPQRVADALAQGDVPIKPEYILSKPPAPRAAARPQPAQQAAASSSGDHYDSREAAAARAAAPPAERALELTLTTEDESLFSGERCLSITVAKARQLCRAIEKELAARMPVTLLLDGVVLCEKNGGLDMLPEDGKATLAVKLQPGSNRAKRKRGDASGANDVPLGPRRGEGDGELEPKKSKRQQKLERRKAQLAESKEKKNQLCIGIATKGVCEYGDACRFSHDVAAYVATKPPDLCLPSSVCPFFSQWGRCPYGVLCRFGSEHIDSNGTVVRNSTATPGGAVLDDAALSNLRSLNHVPKPILVNLRKKRYVYRNAEEAAKLAKKQTELTRKGLSLRGWAKAPAEGAAAAAPAAGASDAASDAASAGGLHPREAAAKRAALPLDGKLYLAPLTTVGNLPFRRIAVGYGADITCGEMAMAKNLLGGQSSEWALLRRHPCEATAGQLFGVQIAGAHVDMMTRVAELLEDHTSLDFVDINMGCPIDVVCNKGMGCGMAERPARMEEIIRGMSSTLSVPLTVKMRMGKKRERLTAHEYLPRLKEWGVCAATLHGRTKEQRYTKEADWTYIEGVALAASSVPLIGNGDIYSYLDAQRHMASAESSEDRVCALMLARGALIKPWLFTEIKEQRHWDISATERLDMLKLFANYGLEHWGSDDQGVLNVRKFLMEWLSFLHRYVPVGLMERPDVSTKLNLRPPGYYARTDLESLMASEEQADWLKLADMVLPMTGGGVAPIDPLKHWKRKSSRSLCVFLKKLNKKRLHSGVGLKRLAQNRLSRRSRGADPRIACVACAVNS